MKLLIALIVVLGSQFAVAKDSGAKAQIVDLQVTEMEAAVWDTTTFNGLAPTGLPFATVSTQTTCTLGERVHSRSAPRWIGG